MCGIFGVVYRDPVKVPDAGTFACAAAAMSHRGPDDTGVYAGPGALLASRRLAIFDLSPAGHMPMSTPDGRYWITYNGAIYNFEALRAELQAKGYVFRSTGDTEVLLQLYVDRGPAMLDSLNGMFAFAIWDTQERRLFAARDRVGIKPFCYAVRGDAVYFASEQKALFAAGVPLTFDASVWEELLCFRFVAGEATCFEGVRKLLPGHYLTFSDGQLRTHQWWSLENAAAARREALPADPTSWFRGTFVDAVRMRTFSDVPVGVLLSGGLDSSAVASVLGSEIGSGISSFTVRFRDRGFDEGEYAKLVAVRGALDYHELFVEPDTLPESMARAAYLNDEPLAHGSDQHLMQIAAYAKPRATVLLSGEGADETLGGYVRYQPLRFPRALGAARPVLPKTSALFSQFARLRKLSRFVAFGSLRDMALYNACDVLPSDLPGIGLQPRGASAYRDSVLSRGEQLYRGDLMRQAMFLDQHTFLCSLLDRNDRMTMGGSIECRVPFLDYRLVETAAALPTSALVSAAQPKALLRRSMGPLLPKAVLRHKKWGFGVPWDRYFREEPYFRGRLEGLSRHPFIAASPLDVSKVRQTVDRYLAGDAEPFALVKQLLMLTVWHDAYLAPRARPAPRPAAVVAP